MTKTQSTSCPACTNLAPMGIQCNKHRTTAPNAQTLLRRELARMVREDGMSPAQAEAKLGVTAGRTIN